MYLKQLQLRGFKSFAHKTILEFSPGITVVVGPNGSGKSNISDAVRWVLGEQSAKSLRGSKMEDVIFAGSKERKPVGMAQVSLVLNNENGGLPLEFSEVDITRKVFRSGDSEYLINKASSRLKDIHELFMDTGVGKESFSIIGQGKVEQILNSKPEDRRYLVEEAAGISKYRYRQQQATRKLDTTEQNIHRLQDLVQEIGSQIEPLGEQAAAAEQYRDIKSRHDRLEIRVAAVEIAKLLEKIEEVLVLQQQLMLTVKEREAQDNVLEANLEQEKFRLDQLEEDINKVQQHLHQYEQQLQRLEGSTGIEKEKRQNALQRIEQLDAEAEKLATKQQQAKTLLTGSKQQHTDICELLSVAEKEVDLAKIKYQDTIDQYTAHSENAEGLKASIFDYLHEESTVKNQLARQDQNRYNYQQQQQRIKKQTEVNAGKLAENKQQQQNISVQCQKLAAAVKQSKQAVANNATEITEAQQQLHQCQQNSRELETDINKVENRLEALETLNKDFEGFYRGVRNILRTDRKQALAGICGPVSQLIEVPRQYELAIETALGAAVQNIVVDDNKNAQAAINHLKQTKGGRATFLPLDTIKPRLFSRKNRSMLNMPGILGLAKDLVSGAQKYQPILEHLLGSVVIAEDLDMAVKAARATGFSVRVVTLAGEIVNSGGALTGGSSSPKDSGLLRREGEINRLKEQAHGLSSEMEQVALQQQRAQQLLQGHSIKRQQLEQGLEERRGQLSTAEQQLSLLRQEADSIQQTLAGFEMERQQLDGEAAALADQEKELTVKLTRMVTERKDAEHSLTEVSQQNQNLESHKNSLAEEITAVKVKLASLQQEEQAASNSIIQQESTLQEINQDIAEKQKERDALTAQVEQSGKRLATLAGESKQLVLKQEQLGQEEVGLKEQRSQLKEQISQLEAAIRDNAKQLQIERQELNQQEVKIARWETEKENHLARLWENHQMSYQQALLEQDADIELKGIAVKLRQLRRELDSLGSVNLGAIEEYQRVSERHQFLTKQLEDLQEARMSLNKVITEMQSIMKVRFANTFDDVNKYFTDMFQQLFGGGTAALSLTDDEDMLEAGIEIIAQPPGKKLSNLSLLSGGEKALTAIALLFGILRYKPSPFCLLDEIDASLDEANVDRFAGVLKKFTADTQFIVISHRQGTMEVANHLYGVTMDKSGISKLVSVKLEENRVS